jgi:outer membrane protein OmpA-like peptidoglycan-associated protein
MNIKALFVFLLFLVYSFFVGRYFVCEVKQVCNAEAHTETFSENEMPVSFSYNGYDALTNARFAEFKLDLINKLGANNRLLVIGLYSPSEENISGYDNLGLARASGFRNLFPEVNENQFIITSEQVPMDESLSSIEGVEWQVWQNNEFITEIMNGAVLHFKTNEDEPIGDEMENYLSDLALTHLTTQRSLDVVGHSDDMGEEGDNFSVALKRANRVKEVLVGKGLDETRVNVTSKGDTEPIAGNDTEDGRLKNRRVEILIN